MFRQTTDFDAIQTLMYWVARIFGSLAGVLWAYLSPSIPFIAICVFAVLIDCITAIRLKRRLQKRYADSEQGNHTLDKAFDLQESTYWQTEGKAKLPHVIIIDTGKSQTISALEYLPRQEKGAPGSAKDIDILIFE